ncbi:MAG: Wzz/FepE/Etk N-terminal domain-containing protein [Sideroxyarcus sp.]|nr:Wzz/FepE/Etk N-terminal domain-containing protein [Sideroxyarcus sp.]
MHEKRTTDSAAAGPQEGEIDLLDLLLVVARAKTTILRITVAAAVLSAAVALLLPAVYTANALILPPQEDRSGLDSMAMSALSELSSAGGGGVGAVLGLKNPSDLYIGMLKSRSVTDAVIRRFKLQELYGTATLVETREELQKQVSISSREDGLISIMFDDEDAQRAADVANAYVEELEKLTRHIAITEAAQRRLFIERQLQQTRDKLAQSEITLMQTQEHTGVIDLDNQGKAIIEAVATLRAQAAAKEVQIASMQSYATPGNPDLIRARQELAGLRAQVGKLEHDKPTGNGDLMVSTGKLPEAGLEYLRKLRDMKYQQALYEMLAKQYEIARVDEARNSVVIQVVDPAVALDEESGPRRMLIIVLATAMTLILAVMGTFLRVALAHMRQNAGQRTRMDELGALLRPRRRI